MAASKKKPKAKAKPKAKPAAKPAQPTQAPAAGAAAEGQAPFVDDIIIWAEALQSRDALVDGRALPRKLTHDELLKLPPVDDDLLPPLNNLIKQGVAIAAIPTTSGIGASCYLVNLATLKKPDEDD